MFYSLTGKLVLKNENCAVIDCSGVGFKCTTSLRTLGELGSSGETVTLFTYMSVREDAIELFGFIDLNELECFKQLINVSGVGPKAAIAVLSTLSPERLSFAVASGDADSVKQAPGIGSKIAQRIVLELKGKLALDADAQIKGGAESFTMSSENVSEAASALEFLGYSKPQIRNAMKRLSPSDDVQTLIKNALAFLSNT